MAPELIEMSRIALAHEPGRAQAVKARWVDTTAALLAPFLTHGASLVDAAEYLYVLEK